MGSVNRIVRYVCPYGCRMELREVTADVINDEGELEVEIYGDRLTLAINAHTIGMHS